MRRNAARTLKTVLLGLRMTLAGAAAVHAVTLPDLSGTWQLNKDASDDPEKAMKDARASGGSSGGSGGMSGGMGMGHGHGHGGSGGGGGSSRGGGGRGADPGAADASPAGSFASLQTLQIRHRDPELTLTDAAQHERVVYTDGRKVEEERSHGGTTAVTASWKDGHIEVVSKSESGTKITEVFAMTADGAQLTVTTRVEGSRGPTFTFRRVYDAVKPPAETAPSPSSAPDGSADDEAVTAR